ncbi:hypothetical protein [Agreia pratensis]|uniref:hypothetical protein n=1 Tax=Agreia pratensis TaxID=150121 RepID=UPI000A1C89D0|nr:hypothetical protein [Agreia pratensis]
MVRLISRRFVVLTAALVGLGLVTTAAGPTNPASARADAASIAPTAVTVVADTVFDPGFIISDELFYDGGALDADEVQEFLDEQVAECSPGVVCLADYTQKTVTREGDDVCGAYGGRESETGAEIIAKVGLACGISQKALLVLLQKEQSLVRNPAPTAGDFSFATGYACPDTAACDVEYSGFYNQLYWAAWQLKRYSNPPGTTEFFTSRPIGQPSPIAYNPDASCGSADVTLKNIATAALYYYTPYQPNAAAIAGDADAPCGAFGNLNFWKFYSEWFGDPTRGSITQGALDDVSVVRGRIVAKGWAIDPSSLRASNSVRITVTDAAGRIQATTLQAGATTRGALTVDSLAGFDHGFNGGTEVAAQGLVRVCAAALPVDGTSSSVESLGCETVFALTP